MSTIQAKRDVLVYEYTWPDLLHLVGKSKNIRHCSPFLKMIDYPEKTGLETRVQLALRENKNLGRFKRKANIFEILWFANSNPEIIKNFGPVEGRDPFTEQTAKEIQVRMTIPCVKMTMNGIELYFLRWDRMRQTNSTLVVTHISELQF